MGRVCYGPRCPAIRCIHEVSTITYNNVMLVQHGMENFRSVKLDVRQNTLLDDSGSNNKCYCIQSELISLQVFDNLKNRPLSFSSLIHMQIAFVIYLFNNILHEIENLIKL